VGLTLPQLIRGVQGKYQQIINIKMVERNYSAREIDQLFKASDERSGAFHEKLMSRMDDFERSTGNSLIRIETQTTKTNGTVRWTVKMIYLAIGGLGVLSIIVIPLLFTLIQAGKI
jgi:hypothetical protein